MAAPHKHRDVYVNIRCQSGASVVGIVTTLWAGWSGVQIQVGAKDHSV
jgi:hypothetical protein